MAAREALAARLDHKALWPREKRWLPALITKRYGRAKIAGRLARANHQNSAAFVQSHTCGRHSFVCPASPEKEDQRAAGSPSALTQLALCLRLAPDLKGRKLATRRNPQ